MGKTAHDHLHLTVGEEACETEDTGCHIGGLGSATRIIQKRVDAVAVYCLITAAETACNDIAHLAVAYRNTGNCAIVYRVDEIAARA